MKKIIILLLTCLFTSTLVKGKIQCMEGIDIFCEEDETCCRSIYGWKCLKEYNGVCCPDGLKVCKKGTFCDPKTYNCVIPEKNKRMEIPKHMVDL